MQCVSGHSTQESQGGFVVRGSNRRLAYGRHRAHPVDVHTANLLPPRTPSVLEPENRDCPLAGVGKSVWKSTNSPSTAITHWVSATRPTARRAVRLAMLRHMATELAMAAPAAASRFDRRPPSRTPGCVQLRFSGLKFEVFDATTPELALLRLPTGATPDGPAVRRLPRCSAGTQAPAAATTDTSTSKCGEARRASTVARAGAESAGTQASHAAFMPEKSAMSLR